MLQPSLKVPFRLSAEENFTLRYLEPSEYDLWDELVDVSPQGSVFCRSWWLSAVGDVRVLDGFDARLDENARLALEKWKFRPGTRNGVAVDVEAVVRVPFKLAKQAF